MPDGNLTISAFADAVNDSLHLGNQKLLRATDINRQLKKMGMLKSETDKNDKKITRATEKGLHNGVIEEEIERTDSKYFRISYNEKGKQFLLNNLIDILNYS